RSSAGRATCSRSRLGPGAHKTPPTRSSYTGTRFSTPPVWPGSRRCSAGKNVAGAYHFPMPDEYFVANVRDLRWQENELGASCEFDKHRERFPEFGINVTVLDPGQPMTMYHQEGYQEGFLVLRGECLLIVEGSEVALREWDYFHCPKNVAHARVGSGAGLSHLLAVGKRVGPDISLDPRDETALRHGAG